MLEHLGKFQATETLKMATFSFMASQLVSKDEREKLATMFKQFDKNGDGKLDKKEIQAGYEKQGKIISDEEVDEIFARIDIDGSGFIDYNEFIAATMDMDEMLTSEKLKRAFAMFDKDGSGSISAVEIKDALGMTGDETMNDKIQDIMN